MGAGYLGELLHELGEYRRWERLLEGGEELLWAPADGDGVGNMLNTAFLVPARQKLLAQLHLGFIDYYYYYFEKAAYYAYDPGQ